VLISFIHSFIHSLYADEWFTSYHSNAFLALTMANRSKTESGNIDRIADAGAHGIFLVGDPDTHAAAIRATVDLHARFAQHAMYTTIDCSLTANPLVQFAGIVKGTAGTTGLLSDDHRDDHIAQSQT
jgi:alkanesulfonate monooxygenase SsuD/methylene tetrahydromethanopterin reductase-like flavin-dependent oxidoreductase (luciferase family)